jgi:tRNA nucleotidyltransferase (CCA-adding enzyme)
VIFAVLTHDLGKATTPTDLLPRHHGHEERSARLLDDLCSRLPVPRTYRDLALHVARYHGLAHRAHELRPSTVLTLITSIDGLRKPQRFESFLVACEADARGRKGLEENDYPQRERLCAALAAALAVDAGALRRERGLEGLALGEALKEQRIRAIRDVLKTVEA